MVDKIKLKELCAGHLHRYLGHLERARSGLKGYRESELIKLISLWNEVAAKNFVFEDLTPEARAEVRDAIADEVEG
jgi:hypothetical protein